MRGRWLLLPLALTACEREPSFDERYDDAQAAIRNTSAELDHDMRAMAANETAAGAADRQEPADAASR